jgi:hypothetical protein
MQIIIRYASKDEIDCVEYLKFKTIGEARNEIARVADEMYEDEDVSLDKILQDFDKFEKEDMNVFHVDFPQSTMELVFND